MSWPRIIERLELGEKVEIRPTGNSMTPLIRSKERVVLKKAELSDITVGAIVLAKVNGRYYLHKITKMAGGRVLISNNHGHDNGWTSTDKVYGIATEIGNLDRNFR